MAEQRNRPFYCGTQGADWELGNCGNCQKASAHGGQCDIEYALFVDAYFGDGTVPESIFERMNRAKGFCRERVTVEDDAAYFKSIAPPPTRLAPLWLRLWRTISSAVTFYTAPWKRNPDDPWSQIGASLCLQLAWGIHKDGRVRAKEADHA